MKKNTKILIIILTVILLIILGSFYFLRNDKVPSIQVVSPKSGDILQSGSTQTIKWESRNVPVSDKISFTIRRVPPPSLQTEGQEFDPIIFIDLPNTGSKDWVVSDTYPEGNYVLGITSYTSIPVTNPIMTESGEFSITKVGAVGLECHDSLKYFAVQKSLSDTVGSDILIKYKTNSSQNYPCAYNVANGDFELKNVLAEYFLTFTDNFLVLDKGTAPEPRGLIVYDLRSRKIVFTDSYAKPVTVSGDSIIYLSKTSIKPTIANCPSLNDYTKNGLGAVIMSKITVDLSTLDKKDLGPTVCLATQ